MATHRGVSPMNVIEHFLISFIVFFHQKQEHKLGKKGNRISCWPDSGMVGGIMAGVDEQDGSRNGSYELG